MARIVGTFDSTDLDQIDAFVTTLSSGGLGDRMTTSFQAFADALEFGTQTLISGSGTKIVVEVRDSGGTLRGTITMTGSGLDSTTPLVSQVKMADAAGAVLLQADGSVDSATDSLTLTRLQLGSAELGAMVALTAQDLRATVSGTDVNLSGTITGLEVLARAGDHAYKFIIGGTVELTGTLTQDSVSGLAEANQILGLAESSRIDTLALQHLTYAAGSNTLVSTENLFTVSELALSLADLEALANASDWNWLDPAYTGDTNWNWRESTFDGDAIASTLFAGNDTIDMSQVFIDEPFELNGFAGDDVLYGGPAENMLDGGAGNDTLYGGSGNDKLHGRDGNDTLYGGYDNDLLNGGRAADTMSGGSGNDLYIVDHRDDQVIEFAGADTGIDTVIAGTNYALPDNVENLVLHASVALRGPHSGIFHGHRKALVDFNIDGTGNAADNLLVGNRAANRLEGGEGADRLMGGAGNDVLNGGRGDDVLSGGAGADTFVFDTLDGIDRIADFGPGDRIRLDANAFAGALDGTDHIIHDGTTGALYYDADGAGGDAAVQFAVLTMTSVGPYLTSAQFVMA